ncbi:four helix bundle protein [Gelidibacter gilvus]|uniref:four helix bundle protein n=1 Tax=Gelidibacter gilvus TaxID=59602 RepID=UPI001CB97F95
MCNWYYKLVLWLTIVNREGYVVRNQPTKSGTSIGANYREANRSRSPRDFKNKTTISLAIFTLIASKL